MYTSIKVIARVYYLINALNIIQVATTSFNRGHRTAEITFFKKKKKLHVFLYSFMYKKNYTISVIAHGRK